jgi:hypothetical protein
MSTERNKSSVFAGFLPINVKLVNTLRETIDYFDIHRKISQYLGSRTTTEIPLAGGFKISTSQKVDTRHYSRSRPMVNCLFSLSSYITENTFWFWTTFSAWARTSQRTRSLYYKQQSWREMNVSGSVVYSVCYFWFCSNLAQIWMCEHFNKISYHEISRKSACWESP